jgi:hypothetical protein
MKTLILDVLILLAVAACGALATGWVMQHHQDTKVTASSVDLSKCTESAAASTAVLARVKSDDAAQIAQLNLQDQLNKTALAKRDATINQLRERAQAASRAIEEMPHAHPDCVALARMPVCPTVAGELWPDQADRRHPHPAH